MITEEQKRAALEWFGNLYTTPHWLCADTKAAIETIRALIAPAPIANNHGK